MTATGRHPLLLHVDGHDPPGDGLGPLERAGHMGRARDLLGQLDGPVLDVGCGPGRLVVALQQHGQVALGIDTSCAAVALARAQGAAVLCRSVFEPLPGEGRWGSVLLFDGNIGIAGDPVTLLARAAELIAPTGQIVVEADPPGWPTATVTARLQRGANHSGCFPWAVVAADGLEYSVGSAGLILRRWVTFEDRWLAICGLAGADQ